MDFLNSETFTLIVLPVLIFIARIFDVSIGTLRIIFLSKGRKAIVPVLGFFEVLIWIVAISKIMKDANNWICMIAYAGGFATGNYVGMVIEEKLAVGVVLVRIITQKLAGDLKQSLIEKGYGITITDAEGAHGKVNIIFTTINRSELKNVIQLIKKYNPKAFYTVEDIKFVNEGVFPVSKKISNKKKIGAHTSLRKGK
ncbi:MAG: DUF2179 domain-containing protein [Marinilabiliales bacterium]